MVPLLAFPGKARWEASCVHPVFRLGLGLQERCLECRLVWEDKPPTPQGFLEGLRRTKIQHRQGCGRRLGEKAQRDGSCSFPLCCTHWAQPVEAVRGLASL